MMKKMSFFSGFGGKMALAVMAVTGLTLASCEKEDFNVNVPNIEITVPEVDLGEGTAVVNFTATTTTGNTLSGVTFKNGTEVIANATLKFTSENDDCSFEVTAEKEGYITDVKTVVIPELRDGAYVVIPVNFVLNTVVETNIEAQPEGQPTEAPNAQAENVKVDVPTGGFEANKSYNVTVPVPTAVPYLDATQRTELMNAVNNLKVSDAQATVRAGEETMTDAENLEIAKQMLRSKISEFGTAPQTVNETVNFSVTEAASTVTATVVTEQTKQKIKLTATVAAKDYTVEGEYTIPGKSSISLVAEGKVIGTGHGTGHGHGTDGNAGGGTGE